MSAIRQICVLTPQSVVRIVTSRAPIPEGGTVIDAQEKKRAGQQLKKYVLDRMAEQGIETLVELSDLAPVSYDRLHAWFRGYPPSPNAGGRVAVVLGVTYSELLAAFEGEEPRGRYVRDDELEALMTAAAEAAIRRVLGDRDEPERNG